MPNELTQYSVSDIRAIGEVIAKSKLFGVTTPEQAIALCMIAHAEGRHPAMAAKDYDIIQNKPSKKSEAMLRDFLQSGGKVEWHQLDDAMADATFDHPQGGKVRISWDMDRAKLAGLAGKDNWKKHPRQMLRSRVVSEGVRTVCPMATSGMYVPEEVQDFEKPKSAMEQWADTPPAITLEQKPDELADLKGWATKMAFDVDNCTSEKGIDELINSYANEMKSLHENLPEWFDRLSVKINQAKEAFQLMHAAE